MPLTKSIPLVLLCLVYLGTAHGQQTSPATTMNAESAKRQTLLSDYNRSIRILATGLKQNWTPDHYRIAFGMIPGLDDAPKHLISCALPIQLLLQPRTIWDERMPFNVEVSQALDQCRRQRDLLISMTAQRQYFFAGFGSFFAGRV